MTFHSTFTKVKDQVIKISAFVGVGILFFLFSPKISRACGEDLPPPSTTEFIISPSQVVQRGEPEIEQVIQPPFYNQDKNEAVHNVMPKIMRMRCPTSLNPISRPDPFELNSHKIYETYSDFTSDSAYTYYAHNHDQEGRSCTPINSSMRTKTSSLAYRPYTNLRSSKSLNPTSTFGPFQPNRSSRLGNHSTSVLSPYYPSFSNDTFNNPISLKRSSSNIIDFTKEKSGKVEEISNDNRLSKQPESKLEGTKPSRPLTIDGCQYASAVNASEKFTLPDGTKLPDDTIRDRVNNCKYPTYFWGWTNAPIPLKFQFPVITKNFKNGPPPILIDKVRFVTLEEATRKLGIEKSKIVYRLKSVDHLNYYYDYSDTDWVSGNSNKKK